MTSRGAEPRHASRHAARAAGNQNQFTVKAVLFKKAQILSRPDGTLKAGMAVVADEDLFLGD